MMNSSQGSPTQGYLRTSAEELGDREWLDNNIFDVQGQWYNTTEGDPTDVNANINNGAANFITEGETHAFSEISGIPQGSDWTKTPNPEYTAYPNDYSDIDPQGCRVEHYWHEDANQLPSVHWERNITMPHDMSNYIITSASITAIVNGSCDSTPSDGGSVGDRGIEAKGDSCANYSTGDYARFYIRISDTVKKKVYEIAWNQTSEYFGLDSHSDPDTMIDTFMTTVSEAKLISYLTSVLRTDYYNFTVTLGIRIRCEDNEQSDRDEFLYLYIKSCNLSFTYEKKISQLTKVSWNQDCDEINSLRYNDGNTVIVLSANLNFDYKISEEWPTALSPNAEIRVLINNYKHSEPIKLSKATTSFQEAKASGFDIYHLIPGNNSNNINFSVQVYLGDEFALNRSITVSIDNVELLISYKIIGIIPPSPSGIDWTPLTIGLGVLLVGLVAVFTSYQLYFRFPPIIRRIRTLRRKIRKGKKTTPILVEKRDAVVKSRLREQLQVLRIQPSLEKADIVSQSKPIGKIK